MSVWGFFNKLEKHWGMLLSFIGAISVLFYSLASIARTIKSVRNAFPNENFVWMNVWNLIIFAVLLLCDYSMILVLDVTSNDDDIYSGHDEAGKRKFDRIVIAYAVFNSCQYVFAMYMDIFLLYLILKFTKHSKVNEHPSIAFLENQSELKDVIRVEVEEQERVRLQSRFKMQLKEFIQSVMSKDKELQLD